MLKKNRAIVYLNASEFSRNESSKQQTTESKENTHNTKSTRMITTKTVASKKTVEKSKERIISRDVESNMNNRVNVKGAEKPAIPSNVSKIVSKRTGNIASKAAIGMSKMNKGELKSVNIRDTTGRVMKTAGPFKASHSIKIASKDRPPQPSNGAKFNDKVVSLSTKNAMNQVHNVTVSSPPPVRRELTDCNGSNSSSKLQKPVLVFRDRTRTRTLEENEIVFVRNEPNFRKTVLKTDHALIKSPRQIVNIEMKEPVSFEVVFKEANHSKGGNVSNIDMSTSEEESNYEDDFDSYESDFESESESSTKSESKTESNTGSTLSLAMAKLSGDDTSDICESIKSIDRENRMVLEKIAVRTTEEERELDSGTFDLKPADHIHGFQLGFSKLNVDDNQLFDERDASSEAQNDSGIEYNVNMRSPKSVPQSDQEHIPSTFTLTPEAKKNSKFYRRGEEITKKISLDTMNFVLYDSKPMAYEQFMLLYGNFSGVQISVQTHNNMVNQESQTDSSNLKNAWTQCPINYTLEHIQDPQFIQYKHGFGCEDDCCSTDKSNDPDLNIVVQSVNRFEMKSVVSHKHKMTLNIDYSSLSRFLKETMITISNILAREDLFITTNTSRTTFSEKWFPLDCSQEDILLQHRITGIHCQLNLPNLLFTIHANVSNKLNFIGVWNIWNTKRPVYFLSTWSQIVCCEIHGNMNSVVMGGLADGSIAVWNLIEHDFWHPNWQQNEKRLIPSQVVTPNIECIKTNICDIGAVVAIKSIYTNIDVDLLNGYNPTQIYSLHECGLLTLWTLMETPVCLNADLLSNRVEHQSPWSNIKLNQSKCIDVRVSIEPLLQQKLHRRPKSGFEKTQSYFENNLFNDSALRELQEENKFEEKFLSKFKCITLETVADNIYIATSENCLLFGKNSFKINNFRIIEIDDGRKIKRYATSLALSHMVDGDHIVLAGLNDGTIKSFRSASKILYDGDESLFSIVSPLPSPHELATMSTQFPNFFKDEYSTGKSCAIQNIVTGERSILDDRLAHLDASEIRKPVFGSEYHKKNNRYIIFDLLNDETLVSRNHSSMAANNKIEKLIYVIGRDILMVHRGRFATIFNITDFSNRVLDDIEIGQNVQDIAIVNNDHNQLFVVVLKEKEGVSFHLLN